MKELRPTRWISVCTATLCLAWMGACTSQDAEGSSDDTSQSADQALSEAQDNYGDLKVQADACFADFEACLEADGADALGCRATLKSCLPAPPPRPAACEVEPEDDEQPAAAPGRRPPPPPDCDEDAGRGRGEGGGPNPPRPPLAAEHRGGGRGHCDAPPFAAKEALDACHATLEACLAESKDRETCGRAHGECVREAARAAFDERCSTELERCNAQELPAEICKRVSARCSEGVDG